MTLRATITAAILVVFGALSAVQAHYVASCDGSCRYTFCPFEGPLELGPSDVAITNQICDKMNKVCVGHVDSTGEAFIYCDGHFTPISKYNPAGLQQNFSPSFWKSFGLGNGDLSGVGHEVPQQNQADFLHGKCFVLPLGAFQILGASYGSVVGNLQGSDPFADCVSFTVV